MGEGSKDCVFSGWLGHTRSTTVSYLELIKGGVLVLEHPDWIPAMGSIPTPSHCTSNVLVEGVLAGCCCTGECPRQRGGCWLGAVFGRGVPLGCWKPKCT